MCSGSLLPSGLRSSVALGLGAACAALVVLTTIAARHAAPAEVSPVVPRGGWNTVWIAGVVGSLVAYVGGVALARASRIPVAAAFAVAVITQCVPLAAPLLLSKDAYIYWADARIVTVHHASPYRATPSDYPNDPATPYTSEEWRGRPAPYGPTWEALALVPGAAAGRSARHAVTAYKLFSLLGVLIAVGLVARATRNAGAVALLGWSPVVALHFAGGGHNDGWLVALLCLAVIARDGARGGAAWSLGAGLKPIGVILFPLELAATRLRRSRPFWVGLVGVGIGLLAISSPLWGIGWVRASLVGVHSASSFGGVHWLTEAGLRHRDAVVVGALVFTAVYCVLLVHAWRRGRARLSLAMTVLCLTTSQLRPWYAIWPLALAAIEEDAPAALAAIGLSAYLLLGDAVQL